MPLPHWLSPDHKYLLGISGGRDSVYLLRWLLDRGVKDIILCHLNHQLRGEESQGDADFVKSLAEDLSLPSEIDSIDVRQLAQDQKLSLETAARDARHLFFLRCASEHNTSNILLAHHADDQAETILFRLLRGSAGAKGMHERQIIRIGSEKLTLLRPLLETRRSSISLHLKTRAIEFREDSSNAEPFATRNRLRNEALPLLEDIMSRDPTEALTRAARRTADLEKIATETLSSTTLLDPQGRIHLPSLREISPAMQRFALRDFLKKSGIHELSEELIENALALADVNSPPSLNLPGGLRLRRKESRLFISS
ncbi:tRNA lysidine(34) synthetase TilS [Akkermansiaceae bacterium]|nr:tRNA lysidine(34) synthetase TilS [Akkermansiaceae bacterium]